MRLKNIRLDDGAIIPRKRTYLEQEEDLLLFLEDNPNKYGLDYYLN